MSKSKQKKLLTTVVAFSLAIFFVVPTLPVAGEMVSMATVSNQQVNDLQSQLDLKKLEIDKLQKKLDVYQQSLDAQHQAKITLTGELEILSEKISQLNLRKQKVNLQIDATNLEIQAVLLKILDQEAAIAKQKDQLAELLRVIYQNDQKNYLEVFAEHTTFSDFFNEVQQIGQVEGGLKISIDNLKSLQAELTAQKADLEQKSADLDKLKNDLATASAKLDQQEVAKTYYLTQAKRSEKQFQALINQGKAEQQKINSDIVSIEKTIRQKLAQGGEQIVSTGRLIWPVPQNIITAYFHDPDYPFREIFEHPAIDIRAAQGTPVKAADSGYVGKVRDGGMGYSYVMLIHENGLATVYGHLSKIYVSADSTINQGDIIGLSGGLPHSPGAGPFTTGAHLHFEVRDNGIPVNPLDYLP